MTIEIRIDRTAVPIDRAVFTTLLDNSVAGTYSAYEKALENGSMRFSELVTLSERGDIPYPLFFAPLPFVEAQVEIKTQKLLAGVSKETFSVNSRDEVQLREVELIVKDLIRKQRMLTKFDKSLQPNKIVGLLYKLGPNPEDDAAKLRKALGLSTVQIQCEPTKTGALEYIIDRLEVNQILVSRSVQNYMPQRLDKARFSGMTIRDNKVPYIFLKGGNHKDHQEPVGRTIFTLSLLTVLVARRIFAPMTWNGGSVSSNTEKEYDIAGALLMPADRISEISPSTLEEMKTASDEFHVTPSAVTVRSMRLGIISPITAQSYLDELRAEFDQLPPPGALSPIKPVNAVRKYNGRELSSRMLDSVATGALTPGEFCRVVCLNHIKPSQLGDLRRALE